MKSTPRIIFTAILCLTLANPLTAAEFDERATARSFEFTYTTTIAAIPAGLGPVHIFLPIPVEDEEQSLDDWSITASTGDGRDSLTGSIEVESEFGNRYWHAVLADTSAGPVEIEANYAVTRRHPQAEAAAGRTQPTPSPADLNKFLTENSRVAVNHPILNPILEEIDDHPQNDSLTVARRIYDWIVDNMTYKKIGTGWGNGDTFWACSERYGNCTDFHSLFISLARTKEIPARFDMGFPIPEDRSQGTISGYHCWVNFYLPQKGWLPVDASEAFNHPEHREFYFGGQPLDRIHFTTGRDLRLGDAHQDRPLNYFIYPYVEVSGERFDGNIESTFSYRDIAAAARVL